MIHYSHQKYFPYALITATVMAGGYLLWQKGIITLPFMNKNSNVVTVDKKSMIDILFTGEEYTLSYAQMNPGMLVTAARFDKAETWQGEGSIEEDKKNWGNKLALIDRDRKKVSSFLLKNLDMSQMDNIKFTVNMRDVPDDVESLNVLFGNSGATSYYRFPITGMIPGINYFSVPKYRFFLNEEKTASAAGGLTWNKIERVQLELVSRPVSKANVDIGWIRGEKGDVFDAEWNWDSTEHFLNLDHTGDGKLTLMVQNVGRSIATLRKIGSVKDFSYSAKMTTLKSGSIGLFFRGDYRTGYGYYLTIAGLGSNEWMLYKNAVENDIPKVTTLSTGQFSNFEFSREQPFWLKVTTKGTTITIYFSLNGTEYTKVSEVQDSAFGSGGVGIVVHSGGSGYVDEFYLNQK